MPQPRKASGRFSFFGLGSTSSASRGNNLDVELPHLKLEADKKVHRSSEPIAISIVVKNNAKHHSLLIEKLSFEFKGVEKLDSQWFNNSVPSLESKQGRGEYVFMDCSTPTIISNQILSSGASRTYVVRAVLPDTIPPSYKGTTIRYLYYSRSILSGQYLILENGNSSEESTKESFEVEARLPLQIWSNYQNGEGHADASAPLTSIILDAYWKESDADSEWFKLNEAFEGVEEGYDSSHDEISSISSYNPSKEDLNRAFGSSLSLQSFNARSSTGGLYVEGRGSVALPRLSVTEILDDILGDKAANVVLATQPSKEYKRTPFAEDDSRYPLPSESVASGASEMVARGRSYNIKLDDRVLLRFTPKNPDSTYYFSDTIGGTLTFFHEEGARQCLEIFITLESKEIINRQFVHPSRRNSPIITKVYSDHHEIVADLLQTSFIFSIPMDGPMTFSTLYVSVEWSLRFEFVTTPKNVNISRFEHPLLIEGRERSEWVLPIIVHAPSTVNGAAQARNRRLFL